MQPEGFSAQEVREAFLRFFVALLQNFRMYLTETDFQAAEFLLSLSLSQNSAEFCEGMMKTQLFNRFLEERRDCTDPEVRFFDESINAKINRSRKTALMNFGRSDVKDTTFLDDTTRVVSALENVQLRRAFRRH
jgi:DENN domain-containing protein 5